MQRRLILFLSLILFFVIGCAAVSVKKPSIPAYHYYFDQEEYQKAIDTAFQFIKDNPESGLIPEALLIIGKSNTRLGIYFRTSQYFLTESGYAKFLSYYEQAEIVYRKITTEYPQSPIAPVAQLFLGKMYDIDPYGGLNLFDKAIEEYKKVIEKYPSSDAAYKAKERIRIIQSQY